MKLERHSRTLAHRSRATPEVNISGMQRTADGRIRYLLAFQDAPWRDGDEVIVESPRDVGDDVEIPDGAERETWEVGDVWEAPDGEPDTLAIWKPPARS